jgi:deazaflavin-dependent oxidoreductase (nitroreductase family)
LEHGSRRWWQRLLERIAWTRFGRWFILNVSTHTDPPLMRWSRGRWSFSALTGSPALLLTTRGAKSGKPRTVPVLYLRDGDDYVVIGTFTGKPRHPGWVHNLRATRQATIRANGFSGEVNAREAGGAERDRLWALAATMYPGYDLYRELAGERIIPVIVLSKIDQQP